MRAMRSDEGLQVLLGHAPEPPEFGALQLPAALQNILGVLGRSGVNVTHEAVGLISEHRYCCAPRTSTSLSWIS
jgi:hypothetical protein